MKKIIFILFNFLFISTTIFGQNNFAQINNQYLHNLGSSQLPSLLGNDIKNGEVFLFPMYFGFGNNFISAYDLKEFTKQEKFTNEYIDKMVSKIPNQGNVWVGLDIPVLNIFFNVNKKNKESFLSFGLGMRERMDLNFTLNRDLFSLLYKGNKQFENKTINLAPSFNFLLYNEYFFAVSGQFKPFKNDSTNISKINIKPALRLRYLNGIASAYMPKSNIDMFTATDGRYIDIKSDLLLNMSSAVDTPDIEGIFEDINFQNLKSSGKGIGLDLGLGVEYFKNLQFNIALTDIGSINFKRNAINYSSKKTLRYEGIEFDNNGKPLEITSIDSLLQADKTYEGYKQTLPTKFILNTMYGIHKKTRKRVDYFEHNLSLTYIQGFKNYLSSSKTPAINLGYAYNLKNMVNAGVNFTFGGINKFQGGAQLGFRLGAIKLGIASNNLLPLISSKTGRGTDVLMYLGIFF